MVILESERVTYTAPVSFRWSTGVSPFVRAQVFMTLGIALLFALPYALQIRAPGYDHLLIMRSTDDGQYHAKVRAVLLGRFDEATNGMTGGNPPAQGGAPALLETAVGWMFLPTGLKAPQVFMLLVIFITPLFFPLLVGLLRMLSFSRALSFAGATLFTTAFLSPLQKPIHMSVSLPFSILTLLLLVLAWRRQGVWLAIVAGIFLGLSVGTYFWAWTYLWSVVAWVAVFACVAATRHTMDRRQGLLLGLMIAIACVVAAPIVAHVWQLHGSNPTFEQTAMRSTIIHSRMFESPARNALLAVIAVAVYWLACRRRKQEDAWAVAIVLAGVTVMYQNLIHGVIFTFASHYYPFVCLSALVALLYAVRARGTSAIARYSAGAAAMLLLLAALWDYRSATPSIAVNAYRLGHLEHLMPAARFLDADGKRRNVLTDRTTAHVVTGWTDDDVVFTAYLRHILITDREYAERFCLSELPAAGGPDFAWLAKEVVEGLDPVSVAERRRQFAGLCESVLANPHDALMRYDIDTLLWNERMHPDWRIDKTLFLPEEQGDGWSVWKVRGSGAF